MNRRDTIIIAVLLNAGVLAILFMLAVNENSLDETVISSRSNTISMNATPSQTDYQQVIISKSQQEESGERSIDSFVMTEETPYSFETYTYSNSETEEKLPSKPLQPTPPSTPPLPSEPYLEVTVKRGDSLDRLARNNGTTIEGIKKINNLKTDMLSIGQVLKIPTTNGTVNGNVNGNKAVVPQKSAEPAKQPSETQVSYYVMKTGDSPWKIARQNNMNLDDLLRLNQLDDEKARNLKVGDKICIR